MEVSIEVLRRYHGGTTEVPWNYHGGATDVQWRPMGGTMEILWRYYEGSRGNSTLSQESHDRSVNTLPGFP